MEDSLVMSVKVYIVEIRLRLDREVSRQVENEVLMYFRPQNWETMWVLESELENVTERMIRYWIE